MFALSLGLGVLGDRLVQFLYAPDYHLAGPILVLLSVSALPVILTGNYNNLLLANGNSRAFTLLLIVTAVLQTAALLIGVQAFGLMGAIIAPVISTALTYPLLIFLIWPYKGWDARHDIFYGVLAILIAIVVLKVNETAIPQIL
jgi:O-antigen/teichoic acid export membrane protein